MNAADYLGTTISFTSPWGTGIQGELLYVAVNEFAVIRETFQSPYTGERYVELHVVDVWAQSLGSYGASAIQAAKNSANRGRIVSW